MVLMQTQQGTSVLITVQEVFPNKWDGTKDPVNAASIEKEISKVLKSALDLVQIWLHGDPSRGFRKVSIFDK